MIWCTYLAQNRHHYNINLKKCTQYTCCVTNERTRSLSTCDRPVAAHFHHCRVRLFSIVISGPRFLPPLEVTAPDVDVEFFSPTCNLSIFVQVCCRVTFGANALLWCTQVVVTSRAAAVAKPLARYVRMLLWQVCISNRQLWSFFINLIQVARPSHHLGIASGSYNAYLYSVPST